MKVDAGNLTSAPIGARKRNFPALLGSYDTPTDRPTNQHTAIIMKMLNENS